MTDLTQEQVDRRERCLALVEQLMTLPCMCEFGPVPDGVLLLTPTCLGCQSPPSHRGAVMTRREWSIIAIACEEAGCSRRAMLGKGRTRRLARARHAAAWGLVSLTDATHREVAAVLDRDVSSVRYGITRFGQADAAGFLWATGMRMAMEECS